MTPAMLEVMIPIIAILATFGFPVGLVFVWKWFKFKEKELQLDAEFRRTSGAAIEQRVQRLESIILALDADLRAKLADAPSRAGLMEPPATQGTGEVGPDLLPPGKVR